MAGYRGYEEITLDDRFLYTESGTSDGTQVKYHKDDYWYKIDNVGGEGQNEYLASLILRCSNLDPSEYVVYDQLMINGKPGCRSMDCTKAGETLVSFYRLWSNVRGGDIAGFLQKMDYDDAFEQVFSFVARETGLDIHRYLANLIAFSTFIRNEDLHYNNMWVIFDGESFRMAPILDNGKSMLVTNKNYDENASISDNLKNVFAKSFSPSFDLNYRYIKKWCDIRIYKDRLVSALDNEPDSVQREFIKYQIVKYPELFV